MGYEGATHGFFNSSRDAGKWYRATLSDVDEYSTSLDSRPLIRTDACAVRWRNHEIGRKTMSALNRRQFVYGAGAVLGSMLLGCGRGRQQAADSDTTVFLNGTVLPVDAAFSEHEALAISGNTILAVGTRDDVLAAAGRGARTIDLAGRVVLPGFIEPHMHFALMAGFGFV